MTRLWASLGCTVLLVACAPERGDRAWTWTVRDYLPCAQAGCSWGGFEVRALVAGDEPIAWRAPPHEAVAAVNQGGTGLVVQPAFSEGEPAAFVLTEIWDAHPTPWVQPAYVLVTAWDATAPASKRLPGSLSVFPVGVESSFYTPFWRLVWAVVPEGTAADAVRSAGDVLRVATSLHPGPLVTCSVVPEDTALAKAAAEAAPRRPLSGEPVSARSLRQAWVDGRKVSYLELGASNFTSTPAELVTEVPIFVFVTRGADGARSEAGLPPVLADRPLRESLARRVDVVLGPELAVFVPAPLSELRASLVEKGVSAPPAAAAIPADVARAFALRVASDARCFGDAAQFPGGCTWLDSQAAIEALPGERRVRTGALVTAVTLRHGAEVLP